MKFWSGSVRWKPATVSWLSFIAIAIIVAGAGLIGNRQIIKISEDQFIAHDVDRIQNIARAMSKRLQAAMSAGLESNGVIARFQDTISQAERFDAMIFLFDAESDRLIARSDSEVALQSLHVTELLRSGTDLTQMTTAGEGRWEEVVRTTSRQGTPLLLYLTSITAHDTNGTADRWVLVVGTDITHLLAMVDELHKWVDVMLLLTGAVIALLGFLALRRLGRAYERSLEGELQARTEELQATHAKMLHRARLAAIGQTASLLTHEARNPLAAIKLGLSGLCGADYLQERERRRVDIVLREVERLDGMLSQTLNYTRPVKLSTDPIPLDHIIDKVMDVVDPLLQGKGIELQRRRCPHCPGLRMDAGLMQQTVLNLVKNAIESCPPGGWIRIDLHSAANAVYLEIANAGPPIAQADLERLFEPFFSTKQKGTGLGLSLVRHVVEEHQGEISVTSDPAHGTRMRVRLPAG